MSELDLVKDLCEAMPPPNPEGLPRARAQLTDAAQAASQARAVGRPRLRHAGLRPPALTRTRLALAAGLVLIVVAALVLAQGITIGGRAPLGPPANAAQLLDRAANAAAAQPMPRNDQFIYFEATGITVASLQPGSQKTVRYTTWNWWSVDGSKPNLVHQRPCQRMPGGPNGLSGLVCTDTIGEGVNQTPTLPQTYADARDLPTNPQQLLAYIRSVMGPGDSYRGVWRQLTLILMVVPVLPPMVAGAVFGLAAELPGVTLLPHTTDAAGRAGIGVVMAGDPDHVELIFDPRSYQYEGYNSPSNQLLPTGGAPAAGAFSVAILHTAVVNSEPAD
jgi:hypothetical protein